MAVHDMMALLSENVKNGMMISDMIEGRMNKTHYYK